jgi:hypothetical protein
MASGLSPAGGAVVRLIVDVVYKMTSTYDRQVKEHRDVYKPKLVSGGHATQLPND